MTPRWLKQRARELQRTEGLSYQAALNRLRKELETKNAGKPAIITAAQLRKASKP
jgi:hypothetical protein